MPLRYVDGEYRYAYQGQEKDLETGMEAFELRLWDSRIGRWLTTDPAKQYASPYLGMGNNPVSFRDPDGAFACDDCPEGTFADGTGHIGADGGTYIYDAEIGRWSDSSAIIFNYTPTTKADNQRMAGALLLSATRVPTGAATLDGPAPFGDAVGGLVLAMAAGTAAGMSINAALQDDYTVTTTTNDPLYLTLYRGVHSEHPRHFAALNGIAVPWALTPVGHNSPEAHTGGNFKSTFTSWSLFRTVADYHADKHGP